MISELPSNGKLTIILVYLNLTWKSPLIRDPFDDPEY